MVLVGPDIAQRYCAEVRTSSETTESLTVQQSDGLLLSSALRDFREARRKAAFEDLKSRLTGRSDDLLSYAEVNRALGLGTSAERTLADIPLDAIVGSVGRYSDFTRSFLPRRSSDAERWAKVKLKMQYHGGLPPIEVYRVGGVYFVLDGNHRVSVARELGATHIQAYVTEVGARIPLTPDVKPDQLIIMARQARFLERTQLDRSQPEADLTVTAPGQYRALGALCVTGVGASGGVTTMAETLTFMERTPLRR